MLLVVAALALCVALSMFVADKYLTNTGYALESNSSDEDNIECVCSFCFASFSECSYVLSLIVLFRYEAKTAEITSGKPFAHNHPTTAHVKNLLKQAIHDETIEKTRAIAFKHDGTDVPAKH